jgi:hypothetical protein
MLDKGLKTAVLGWYPFAADDEHVLCIHTVSVSFPSVSGNDESRQIQSYPAGLKYFAALRAFTEQLCRRAFYFCLWQLQLFPDFG